MPDLFQRPIDSQGFYDHNCEDCGCDLPSWYTLDLCESCQDKATQDELASLMPSPVNNARQLSPLAIRQIKAMIDLAILARKRVNAYSQPPAQWLCNGYASAYINSAKLVATIR